MSPIKNVALVNELGQVVNHVVVDTDDAETMAGLHEYWKTTRYVETTETDTIILDESDDIWTTHCEDPNCAEQGFTLPIGYRVEEKEEEHITRKMSELPADSLLLEANKDKRPEGWVFPSNMTLIEG